MIWLQSLSAKASALQLSVPLWVRDWAERGMLCLFTAWLTWRLWAPISAGEVHPISAMVLFGEYLVLGFVLFSRPAKEVSTRPQDWLLGFLGAAAPLFVSPGGAGPLIPPAVAGLMFAGGIVLSLSAKINLNRSFGIVAANRGVVTRGFYSVVRHPVYASYLVGHVAFLLLNPTLWNLSVYVAAFGLQVLRMNAEEAVLSRDPAYAAYKEKVRYRILPGVY